MYYCSFLLFLSVTISSVSPALSTSSLFLYCLILSLDFSFKTSLSLFFHLLLLLSLLHFLPRPLGLSLSNRSLGHYFSLSLTRLFSILLPACLSLTPISLSSTLALVIMSFRRNKRTVAKHWRCINNCDWDLESLSQHSIDSPLMPRERVTSTHTHNSSASLHVCSSDGYRALHTDKCKWNANY